MQAIILAAGMGKRLGDLTKENTKCMVKVNGVCLIDRLLNQLSSLPLTRIILVVGYQGQKLRQHGLLCRLHQTIDPLISGLLLPDRLFAKGSR